MVLVLAAIFVACTPTVAATGLAIDSKTALAAEAIIGDTKQLAVTYTPADANTNTAVTYSTSDATVATVSATGLVTYLKLGAVTITAKLTETPTEADSYTATITVKSVTAFSNPAPAIGENVSDAILIKVSNAADAAIALSAVGGTDPAAGSVAVTSGISANITFTTDEVYHTTGGDAADVVPGKIAIDTGTYYAVTYKISTAGEYTITVTVNGTTLSFAITAEVAEANTTAFIEAIGALDDATSGSLTAQNLVAAVYQNIKKAAAFYEEASESQKGIMALDGNVAKYLAYEIAKEALITKITNASGTTFGDDHAGSDAFRITIPAVVFNTTIGILLDVEYTPLAAHTSAANWATRWGVLSNGVTADGRPGYLMIIQDILLGETAEHLALMTLSLGTSANKVIESLNGAPINLATGATETAHNFVSSVKAAALEFSIAHSTPTEAVGVNQALIDALYDGSTVNEFLDGGLNYTENKALVEAARSVYTVLNAIEKGQINLTKLLLCEARIAVVDVALNLKDAIGLTASESNLTAAIYQQLKNGVSIYDGLTTELKALVTNYASLAAQWSAAQARTDVINSASNGDSPITDVFAEGNNHANGDVTAVTIVSVVFIKAGGTNSGKIVDINFTAIDGHATEAPYTTYWTTLANVGGKSGAQLVAESFYDKTAAYVTGLEIPNDTSSTSEGEKGRVATGLIIVTGVTQTARNFLKSLKVAAALWTQSQ